MYMEGDFMAFQQSHGIVTANTMVVGAWANDRHKCSEIENNK